MSPGRIAIPLECSPNARSNFGQTEQNRPSPVVEGAAIESPAFLMTRDGFALLAMGFTGKRALHWKLKYIEAFNAMENELRNRIRLSCVFSSALTLLCPALML